MATRIIGYVMSENDVKYFVRYCSDDNLLQVSTASTGPWFVVMDQYMLDEKALDYAKRYIDNIMV